MSCKRCPSRSPQTSGSLIALLDQAIGLGAGLPMRPGWVVGMRVVRRQHLTLRPLPRLARSTPFATIADVGRKSSHTRLWARTAANYPPCNADSLAAHRLRCDRRDHRVGRVDLVSAGVELILDDGSTVSALTCRLLLLPSPASNEGGAMPHQFGPRVSTCRGFEGNPQCASCGPA